MANQIESIIKRLVRKAVNDFFNEAAPKTVYVEEKAKKKRREERSYFRTGNAWNNLSLVITFLFFLMIIFFPFKNFSNNRKIQLKATVKLTTT